MLHRRRWLAAIAALAFAGAAPARAQITPTSVTLQWTAPGDDSTSGRATQYDLRVSTSPITDQTFASATRVANVPAPNVAGTLESFAVGGLVPSTAYWFAIKTVDDAGNWSAISNIASATTAASSDSVRPAALALSASATTNTSVTLAWIATGDDSLTGTATAYDVRWSLAPITDANWASANQATGEPAPAAPGTPQTFTIGGLNRTVDLYFAAKAIDDVNRASALSNDLLVGHVLDTAPPAAPSGLAASPQTGPSVHLHWTANAEPDLAGYHVWRATSASGPFTSIAGNLVTNDYTDAAPPDSASLWYAVTAFDLANNESARSASAQVWLSAAGIAAWSVEPPYPNPSHLGDPVTFPVEVPASGPFDGRLDIQNAAGEHVRTLELRGLTPGLTQIAWDGRNDAGRATAPGVYHAWLVVSGASRTPLKIARIP